MIAIVVVTRTVNCGYLLQFLFYCHSQPSIVDGIKVLAIVVADGY